MVQDSAQIRRRGAQDFLSYYECACARQESVPLPAVKMNLEKGMLDFNGDRVKLADWAPILNSISINKHLNHIAISSPCQASLVSGDADRRLYKSTLKRRIPAIRSKDMTFKLCKALRDCMSASSKLKTLQLNGLPLRRRDLIILTKGFAKSVSLENLSLANCPINDEGLEVICQSVKYSACIRTIDFTGCNLTFRGAEHMAGIIKHQGMQRHGTAWVESLRYRQPHFEGMGGLKRITLNCNTLIGDRGAAALASELTEDLWVKAVDLQWCGLSSEGARRLLEALKTNSTLCVLDIRNNPLVDKVLIKTIIEKVLMNGDGGSQEYGWMKPAATEPQRAAGHKRRPLPASVRGKAALTITSRKGGCPGGRSSGAARLRLSSRSDYMPWHTAARAGRQRGLPPGAPVIDQRFEGATTVKVTLETDSEEEEDEEGEEVVVEVERRRSPLNVHDSTATRHSERLQMELKECRLRLAEERRARLKTETRLMEFELENARLRSANSSLSEALASTGFASGPAAVNALEDEAVLQSIESSFTKFHAFLDLLKDAGLGQLASMAGIDRSDLPPLGRPPLSSTMGPPLEGAAHDTKADVSVMMSPPPPPRPSGHFEIFTPTSRPGFRGPPRGRRQLDETLTQAAGSAVVTGVRGEGDSNVYSRRVTHESRFGEGLPVGQTFEVQPRRAKSNSSSHRSSGSHGNGFNSSDASNSRGSHGDPSALSDKAESPRSTGSKRRGAGRLLTEGRSGSEGSEGAVYAGMEILEQVRSVSSLGRHSDQESF